jgi:PTS system nitrogen regulatory IIA component
MEDFDINSLSAYLHLTPEQVKKMAERNKLPGRRIGGQWRFSRPEIHQWFEDRIGVSDERELMEVEKVFEIQSQKQIIDDFHIPDLLTIDNIAAPLLARTKSKVISKMCELAAASGALWEPEKMAEAISNREQLHPTALENGVALLHPRRPMPNAMGEAFLALGITHSGIPFGGPRGCLSDIFFLIGSVDEAVHLRLLARLSRLIQVPQTLDEMRAQDSPAGVWDIIHQADQTL